MRRQPRIADQSPVARAWTEIVVVFAGDTARIESETGPPIVMQRRPSASGFWYESGTHSIRGAGDEITYTIGRMAPELAVDFKTSMPQRAQGSRGHAFQFPMLRNQQKDFKHGRRCCLEGIILRNID